MKNHKPTWSEADKESLIRQAVEIKARLGRPLRPRDLKKVRIPRRSFFAIKGQAARLKLYDPVRQTKRWTEREEKVLVLLAKQRGLGARSIKQRGFFSEGEGDSLHSRSVDSIAQKIRRHGLVDPERSRRARYSKRLDREERRRLRDDLRKNPRHLTTEEFAGEYGVAPSTIRRYRKKWRIPYSWHEAMSLPASQERREQLSAETRDRNLANWERRKQEMRQQFIAARRKAEQTARRKGREPKLRQCSTCGESWPATKTFFAPSPKRRDGEIVRTYLRRSCRVCPRRGKR